MLGKNVIVRTRNAGVHYGKLETRSGAEVVLSNARRIWFWSGAASLSQLALDGVANPGKCKFPEEVPEILLTETIEIIPTTPKADQSIAQVAPWRA